MSRPQKTAKHFNGATGLTVVEKNATAVVIDVRNIATAASGKATAAMSSTDPSRFWILAFFHLSTTTKTSSAPSANETKTPIKFKNGKNSNRAMKKYTKYDSGKLITTAASPISVIQRDPV